MNEKLDRYHNVAQERAMRALLILAGHEAQGLAPVQLAKALQISQSLVTRDLWNLQHAGCAERLENGNWRLGPKVVQIALAFQRGLADLKRTAEEIEQRFTREPK
jgi:DNA-binding IclR family transcriptional regulator